jgi:hypothetical protein
MVDRLKGAVDGLEPPICPKCHIGMLWWKSELIARTAKAIVEHSFYCGSCGRQSKTKIDAGKPESPPPAKLSRPRRWSKAA